jgi:hypothetical protein
MKTSRTLRQLDPGADRYELQNGQVITYEEFQKLKNLMPGISWICVVWGKLPCNNQVLDFKNAG